MEKFDIKESWLVKLNANFEAEKEKINPKDMKFFNIDILMDLARLTQKHSYDCDICKVNKDILMNLSTSIYENINTIEGRREITKKLDKVSTHLRKEHKYYIRRYMSSLYTLVFLLVGLLSGILMGYITKNYLVYILVNSAIAMFIGSLAGSLVEKKLLKSGKIYGKF